MPEEQLKQAIIDRDIERGTRFLRALSTVSAIRRILVQAGYTTPVHQEGWGMLLTLLGYTPAGADMPPPDANPPEKAIAELDMWDGPNFTRARAALEHLHPDQARYIFAGLAPTTGAAAVATVKTFLDRVQALRDGTDNGRAGSRDDDTAAVESLEKRGIVNADIETHLRKQIETAMQLAPAPVDADRVDEVAYMSTAVAFHAWLTDWRATARAVMTRRDYLIRLGLAQRRRGKVAIEADDVDDESVAPEWHNEAHTDG